METKKTATFDFLRRDPEAQAPDTLDAAQERKRRKAEEGETLKLAVFADSAVFLRLTTF